MGSFQKQNCQRETKKSPQIQPYLAGNRTTAPQFLALYDSKMNHVWNWAVPRAQQLLHTATYTLGPQTHVQV